MCGAVIEILFLIAGLWLIVSGKIPQGLFKLMFGKGRYVLPTIGARLFGLLLASPFPVVLGVSRILSMIFGMGGLGYSVFFETGYLIILAIVAIIIARKIKQPEQPI